MVRNKPYIAPRTEIKTVSDCESLSAVNFLVKYGCFNKVVLFYEICNVTRLWCNTLELGRFHSLHG